ncbi:MAG TPA: hypothetical protein VMV92_23150 [Streptosporangiaceae bacterium]|nr:hypothetical protein [Streptosporangiaceae bacterium]
MKAAVLALCAVIVLAASYAAGGQAGLLAVAAVAAVAALLAARLRIPAPPRRAVAPRQARFLNSAFAGYRHIDAAVSDGRVSRRHFDLVTRPLLQRLLAALLADRRRADIRKDARAAREAVGDDLWPFLDPARPASADSGEPGLSLETMTKIADRLEDL